MQYLAPADLMKIDVQINGKEVKGLIDSGATISLIKSSLVKDLKINNIDNESKYITSLGNNRISVSGLIDITVNIFGIEMMAEFLIVNDENIGNDLILGMNFLKKNKFAINMNKGRITITKQDNSKLTIKLNENNKVVNTWRENIPVYAKSNVTLRRN